jgi:hypothetical protein
MNLRISILSLILLLTFVSCAWSQEKESQSTSAINTRPGFSSADKFKNLLFADQSLEEFAADFKIKAAPAKDDFSHYFALALDNARKGKTDEARKNLKYVLDIPNVETRVQLWAWRALRQFGEKPAAKDGSEVRGVVIEVPIAYGYDTLAVYRDESLRYINYTGKIAVWDAPDDRFSPLIKNILESSQSFINKTPVSPSRKVVQPGFVLVSILTLNGIYQVEAEYKQITVKHSFIPFIENGGRIIIGLAELLNKENNIE